MKKITGTLLLCVMWPGIVAAQGSAAGVTSPPKVLVVTREYVKPGKNGMTHEKTESAFVQAFRTANWPTRYFAADSLSGKARSLFFTGYDSFEAWEKDAQAVQKNTTLSEALDQAGVADGDLLDEVDTSALVYRQEYSLRASVDIAHMRYFDISLYRVRPGHQKDWDDLVKAVLPAYDKMPDVHWATYEAVYGQQGTTYIIFTPMKSAAEIDQGFARDKQFEAAMGPAGMKRISDLEAAAVDSSQSNLFMFNPRMSYPPDAWVKADPDFWAPKPTGTH